MFGTRAFPGLTMVARMSVFDNGTMNAILEEICTHAEIVIANLRWPADRPS